MNITYSPKLESLPTDLLSLADYEQLAEGYMSESIWAYLDGGAGDEISKDLNVKAFDRWTILPRALQSFNQAHTHVTLFGKKYPHPIFVAPVGYQRLVHPQGELATAEAARALNAGIIVSTQASTSLEDIGHELHHKWFQLYVQPQQEDTLKLIRRAENAGYQALVITVDAPISGLRLRSQRAGFVLPDDVYAVNLQDIKNPERKFLDANQSIIFHGIMANAPQWQDIEWIKRHTQLPVLLKGILHPQDAIQAKDRGIDGLIISNHGGRTLDSLPAPLTVLPSVRAAVGSDYPLLMDGGIRRGTDIFKALALGANSILIGRPIMHGLAIAGALGVAHTLKLLRQELEITMALAGTPTLADIQSDCLLPA